MNEFATKEIRVVDLEQARVDAQSVIAVSPKGDTLSEVSQPLKASMFNDGTWVYPFIVGATISLLQGTFKGRKQI